MSASEAPKPKKSVALSGVVVGNTALCSVGHSGNDLHYRGYDVLDIAETCRFRRNCPPVDSRRASRPGKTHRIPGEVAFPSRNSRRGPNGPRNPAGLHASHGRHAHRRLGARLLAPRIARSQPGRRQRHRRPPDRLAPVNAPLLVSLRRQRPPHPGRDRRRFDRRSFPPPPARPKPLE